MILAKLSLATLTTLQARATERSKSPNIGTYIRACDAFRKITAEIELRAACQNPKVKTWLASTLKEMNETSLPGRCWLLNERYHQVIQSGSYWANGCWVQIG